MSQRRSIDEFRNQFDDFKAKLHHLAETQVVAVEVARAALPTWAKRRLEG